MCALYSAPPARHLRLPQTRRELKRHTEAAEVLQREVDRLHAAADARRGDVRRHAAERAGLWDFLRATAAEAASGEHEAAAEGGAERASRASREREACAAPSVAVSQAFGPAASAPPPPLARVPLDPAAGWLHCGDPEHMVVCMATILRLTGLEDVGDLPAMLAKHGPFTRSIVEKRERREARTASLLARLADARAELHELRLVGNGTYAASVVDGASTQLAAAEVRAERASGPLSRCPALPYPFYLPSTFG